jgi:hypothetical protein
VYYEHVHKYEVQKFVVCTTNSVNFEVQLFVVAAKKKKKGTGDEDQKRTTTGPLSRRSAGMTRDLGQNLVIKP